MSDFVFNIAKGKIAHYASLPGPSDSLVVVPLKASGLETDAVLRDYDTLSALLANNTEQTTVGRKQITSTSVLVDDTNDRVDCDFDDLVWTNATGDPIAALLVVYVESGTATGADGVLLTKHDFPVTPTGASITAQVNVFARAS